MLAILSRPLSAKMDLNQITTNHNKQWSACIHGRKSETLFISMKMIFTKATPFNIISYRGHCFFVFCKLSVVINRNYKMCPDAIVLILLLMHLW